MLSSISAESTLNVSGHHIRNGHLFAGVGRGITTQRALHLRDWKKIGNNDEVVGNKIEEGMNQGKKLLRGGVKRMEQSYLQKNGIRIMRKQRCLYHKMRD